MERQVFSWLIFLTCHLVNFMVIEAQTYTDLYSRYLNPKRPGDTCLRTCRNVYKPVCGSDLKTYRNGCEFKRSKCINNESKFIYLKESCPPYITQCHLTHYCEAGRKVCGTDGVTYASVCHMTTAKCNTGVNIASKGACGKSQNLRRNGRVRGYTNPRPMPVIGSDSDDEDRVVQGSVAVINTDLEFVRPRVTNIPLVTRVVRPATEVIANIRRRRPQPRPEPKPRPVPQPRPRPVPRPTQRPWRPMTERSVRGRITRVTRRPTIERPVIERPTVVRPRPTSLPRVYPRVTDPIILTDSPCDEQCSLEYDPVCGTDDNTYVNACILRAVACQKGIDLTVWYGGSCIISTTPAPPIYTTPLPYPEARPNNEEKCIEGCPIEYRPVCGTDGVTYPSPCIIESMSCLYKNPLLQIDYEGECKIEPTMVFRLRVRNNPCKNMRCKNGNKYKPVCGSDKKIYNSICELDKRACKLRDKSLVDVEVKQCIPKVKLHIVNRQYVVKLDE